MTPTGLRTVFLVDDDAAVRDALGLLLLAHGYTVRTFESGETFLKAVDARSEGCAILDVRMEGMTGLDVFDEMRQRGLELIVLFLSGHGDIPMAVQAVKLGAFDFLEKPTSEEALLNKLNDALSIASARKQSRSSNEAIHTLLSRLSAREREVMDLVLAGKLNKQIAGDLLITIRTVEVHRANVFAKMGVRSAVELAQRLAGQAPAD